MADGCHNHEVAIGLNNNKEAGVSADILALRNAEAAFGTAKDVRQDAREALQAVDATAGEFLGNAINGTSNNSNGVDFANVTFSDPPTQTECQLLADKMNELIGAWRR